MTIYQLKILLTGSKPPIWRRVLVPDNLLLSDLHELIQALSNWQDYHLHQFDFNDQARGVMPTQPYYSSPNMYGGELEPDDVWDTGMKDSRKVKLSELLTVAGQKFYYTYDFGDDWKHEITVEKLLEPKAGMAYPVCIKGKRAMPLEDCGGIWGYEAMLDALHDDAHPEREDIENWLFESFGVKNLDPEHFDLDEENSYLKPLQKKYGLRKKVA